MEERRPPAALVLGVLAGVLAAVAILPTIVPLTRRVSSAEDMSSVVRAITASRAAGTLLAHGLALEPRLDRSLAIDGLRLIDGNGATIYEAGSPPPDLPMADLCPPGEAPGRVVRKGEDRWAVACHDVGASVVLATLRAPNGESRTISWLVLGLASMVGISTAFGVLQVLSPLSRITSGLERVGSGERGVHVASTGLAELDELVVRLNHAARAIQDREDAIQGRIQVVQEIARVVAHEIRNPLQSLEFLAGVIAMEDDGEERSKLSASIQDEVRSLEAVVSRMLRGGDGPALHLLRTSTSLGELVRKVVDFRMPEARHKGIELAAATLSDRALPVDRTLLTRAIENLVSNAMEFVPKGAGKIVLSAEEEGDRVTIVVEDNGPGVPATYGDTIYQPGVSYRAGGHGLGLSFVQGVFTAHGGSVTHGRSALGGAAFRASIPLEEPAEELSLANPGGR